MDASLIAAFEAASPNPVLLVSVALSGGTVRLTDGMNVVWGADQYVGEHATYGRLGGVGDIQDGADGQATVCDLTILCDGTAMALWIAPAEQGALVTVYLGALNRSTGLLIGEPELLFRGELDQPRLSSGPTQALVFDCITEEARMLEPNEEQRLTDSFQQSVWPGDLGLVHVSGVEKKIYWREDDPNNAIS